MSYYIHYGCSEFDPNKFQPIKNKPRFTKPSGGFWASRIGARFGWRDWCLENDIILSSFDRYIKFRLKKDAKIIQIGSLADIVSLPHQPTERESFFDWHYLDFEKMANEGVDAIEVAIAGEGVYPALCGWDCDSILIMNKDIILPH